MSGGVRHSFAAKQKFDKYSRNLFFQCLAPYTGLQAIGAPPHWRTTRLFPKQSHGYWLKIYQDHTVFEGCQLLWKIITQWWLILKRCTCTLDPPETFKQIVAVCCPWTRRNLCKRLNVYPSRAARGGRWWSGYIKTPEYWKIPKNTIWNISISHSSHIYMLICLFLHHLVLILLLASFCFCSFK